MQLFKNKYFLKHMLWAALAGAAGTGAAMYWDRRAGIACLCTASVIIILDYIFTKQRYRDIGELSDYLNQIAAGNLSLGLPDYQEGELSILKTNLYKTADKLRFQAEELKKDKAYLADSLADISHQLKTPVTSMMVMSDLLKNQSLEPVRQREFLNHLDRQLEKTQWIITNILKLSKIDADQIRLKEEDFRLSAMVQAAAAPFQILAEVKGQQLIIDGDQDAVVTGDENWTAEAVSNLIKNCIEHTPEGGRITVEYRCNVLYTTLKVSDNGTGIAAEDLPHIFERFYKGKNSSADSVGIGLALAKTILNKENAIIEVRSREQEGTVFEIRFYKRVI